MKDTWSGSVQVGYGAEEIVVETPSHPHCLVLTCRTVGPEHCGGEPQASVEIGEVKRRSFNFFVRCWGSPVEVTWEYQTDS